MLGRVVGALRKEGCDPYTNSWNWLIKVARVVNLKLVFTD